MFLVLTGYVATKSTRDALFIARFGAAALPYADVASAVGVVLAMALYLRLGRRLPLPHLQTGALAAFAAAAVGFWWAGRRLDSPWLLPVLYIWASVFGVLLPVQVWTLANHVITPRQAKRLFGVIGSGAISGCIAGGLLTRTVATRAGADTLLLVTAAALAAAIALVWAVWRTRPARPFATTAEWTSAGGAGLLAGFAQVRRRRYLSMLALMVTLSSIVTTIVAWQFRAVAGDAIRNTDDLAAFFGGFLFYAGLLSLATQLLVTGPLLRRVGLGSALLVLPIALAGGSAALALTGSLGAAVLLRGGDQVLRYAIDRPATEILYLPLPDAETFVAKSIIDTVLLRSGDCIGSLIVLAALALAVTPAGLGVVTLALGATWLAATRVVRREYVRTLQDNIRAHRLDAERLAEATASDRTAADAIAAIAALESRLADPDAAVRTEAFLALARLTDVDPLARLTDLDAVEDVSLHLSLVAYLSREGPQQNPTAARLLLDAAFAAASGSPEARLSLARALEVLPDETLEGFADAAVPLVGELLDARHAPALRRRAPGLLRRLGTPAADRTLVEHVTDPDPEVRREILLALNALRRLEPHRAIDRKLVETALAAEILGHYRSHQLLADAGVASGFSRTADGSDAGAENAVPIDLEGELERIFRMLKLLYPDHDLQSAYVGARSGNPGVHDHALEFLEHTLPPRLWDVLVPLLDHEANPDAPRALDAAIRRLARS